MDDHVVSKQRFLSGPARDMPDGGVDQGVPAALDAVNGFIVDGGPGLGPGNHVARANERTRPLDGIGRRRGREGVRIGHEDLLMR